jgi:hypothetical protein
LLPTRTRRRLAFPASLSVRGAAIHLCLSGQRRLGDDRNLPHSQLEGVGVVQRRLIGSLAVVIAENCSSM